MDNNILDQYKNHIGYPELNIKDIDLSSECLELIAKYYIQEYIKKKLGILYKDDCHYKEWCDFKLNDNLIIIKAYHNKKDIKFTENQKLNLNQVIVLFIKYRIIKPDKIKICKIYFKHGKNLKGIQ